MKKQKPDNQSKKEGRQTKNTFLKVENEKYDFWMNGAMRSRQRIEKCIKLNYAVDRILIEDWYKNRICDGWNRYVRPAM